MPFSPTCGSSGHSQSSRASAGVVVVVASLRFSPSLPLLQLLRVPNRHGRRCSAAVADLYLFVIFHPEVVLLSSCPDDLGVFQFVSFSQGCYNVGVGVTWPAVVMET